MHRKWTWVWRAFLVFLTIGTFFGFVPSGWSDFEDVLTSVDVWLLNQVAYPALSSIVFGLILGTWIIPDCWRYFRNVSAAPLPDLPGPDALNYVLCDSKLFKGRGGPGDDKIPFEAEGFLRNAARLGRLTVWGRRRSKYETSIRKDTVVEIDREYWDQGSINVSTMLYRCYQEAVAEKINGGESAQYRGITFNYREIRSVFRPMNWIERWTDKNRAARKGMFLDEPWKTTNP